MSDTWTGPLQKIAEYRYRIPVNYRGERQNLQMKTSAVIYASDSMIPCIRADNAPEQAANVTMLPGIVGESLAMPDIHWGYGFPIGGVAATDSEVGVVSPGGVGFDINCGVRLVRTNLCRKDLSAQQIQALVDEMFKNVPSGLGSHAKVKLNRNQLEKMLTMGARWAIENGYGWAEDVDYLEENGCLKSADDSTISEAAKQRGAPQLGSLGAGNHFLEIQQVADIYDPVAAKVFGVTGVGQIMVMIHTGSRGFGHQVCTG